jgi:YidC/Oxa1 family membrane protein insertase
MDLSQSATGVSGGFVDALPYFVLVGLVIVTGFLQARQSKRNSPNMPSQMAMITTILPIAFGVFSLQFPAGLVLYFLISNLWRLGQQELIMRKITRPGMAANAASSGGAIDVKSSSVEQKSGGLRKLFQLPSAANGETVEDAGDAGGNGAATKKPAAKSPSTAGGGSGTASKGGSAQASSRPSGRRNNKKRKRR